jgi:hypothetical protein
MFTSAAQLVYQRPSGVQGLKQVDSHSNLLLIFLQLANQIAKECQFFSNKNVQKSQIANQIAEVYFERWCVMPVVHAPKRPLGII